MREERHEILDAKITQHDRHRFEIKLDLELLAGRTNTYKVETYFFVPRALNINPSTYDKKTFYNNSQRYIRFKTPKMSMGQVVDPAVELSPLNRINARLPKMLQGEKDRQLVDGVCEEIKLLGCVLRGGVRDNVRFLLGEIEEIRRASGGSGSRIESLSDNVAHLVADIAAVISRIRALRMQLANPIFPAKVRESFCYFDEFLSLSLSDYLKILLEGLRSCPELKARLAERDAQLCAVIKAQNDYRRTMGYASVAKKGTSNEVLVYRRGVLKKFVSSALFLNIEISEWEGWYQFLFGLAAGVSMLFAVLSMLLVQSKYATDSVVFVAVAVVSYIFKDRMKDLMKLWLSRKWTNWLSDRQTKIKDPHSGGSIGTFKESFSFLTSRNIPREINDIRNADNIASIDNEGKPEMVMRYEKEVSLFPEVILKAHLRKRDLNDIFRFNVTPLIVHADDPAVDFLYYDSESGGLETIFCARVYHVNMVIRYTSFNSEGVEQVSCERFRLVLNRDGIVRLDQVAAI